MLTKSMSQNIGPTAETTTPQTTTPAMKDQTTPDATIKVRDADVHAFVLGKDALAVMIGPTEAIISQALIAQIV
jgi:hypothetical protein